MLRHPRERAALLDSLRDVQRLVLLGDVLELRQGPLRDALAVARPVFEAIGQALPSGAEVVIVPGNHDHVLLRRWWERRAREGVPEPLSLQTPVEWEEDEPLGRVASWLAPARLRAAYPGVWLRPDVYAVHGHYGDRHTTVPMLERLGAGMMARIVREPAAGPTQIEDYEATLAPLYAWIDSIAQHGRARSRGASAQAWRTLTGRRRGRLRRAALAAAFPVAIAAANRAGLGPLRRDISGPELRRAGLLAQREALTRLDVHARYVIFGHTHRAGPLPDDDRLEWEGDEQQRLEVDGMGRTELVNVGCWVHEPSFLGADPASSPYRPGFAAVVERGDGRPRLVNVLDGVSWRARG